MAFSQTTVSAPRLSLKKKACLKIQHYFALRVLTPTTPLHSLICQPEIALFQLCQVFVAPPGKVASQSRFSLLLVCPKCQISVLTWLIFLSPLLGFFFSMLLPPNAHSGHLTDNKWHISVSSMSSPLTPLLFFSLHWMTHVVILVYLLSKE